MQLVTEWILPPILYTAGMLFWPISRVVSPRALWRNRALAWIAVAHVVLVGGVTVLTYARVHRGAEDALHLMTVAAFLAVVSFVACVVVVVLTMESRVERDRR